MNSVKKYLCNVTKPLVILCGLGALFAVVSLYIRTQTDELGAFIFMLCMGALLIIIGIANAISAASSFKQCAAEWARKNITQDVADDFQKSDEWDKGQVRLGAKYLFVQGAGLAVAYSDIRQMTVAQEKDMKGRVDACLRVVCADGREHKLLSGRYYGGSPAQYSVANEIQRRCPSVRVD